MKQTFAKLSPFQVDPEAIESAFGLKDGDFETASLSERDGDLPYGEIRYIHYDPQPFYDSVEQMCRLADEGDAAGTAAAYDLLYEEYLYIDSLHTKAMLDYDADYGDDHLTEEYTYSGALQVKAQDALLSGVAYVLESDCGADFAAHIGEENAELCRGYEGSGGETEVDTETLEILDEYYALYDSIGELSFSYNGESWDVDKLYGFRGTALASRDYDAYLTVYNGLQRVLTETFAPLYIRLVELWTKEARQAGYDSFPDYAYDYLYPRDYSPEDAQRFCDAVKPIAREYYADLYYSDISYGEDEISPLPDGEALLSILGEYLPRIDPSLLEEEDITETITGMDMSTEAISAANATIQAYANDALSEENLEMVQTAYAGLAEAASNALSGKITAAAEEAAQDTTVGVEADAEGAVETAAEAGSEAATALVESANAGENIIETQVVTDQTGEELAQGVGGECEGSTELTEKEMRICRNIVLAHKHGYEETNYHRAAAEASRRLRNRTMDIQIQLYVKKLWNE